MVSLNKRIDWENFREPLGKIRQKERKNAAGRKPYDVVLMFKIVVLQHLYNRSDDEMEYKVRECLERTFSKKIKNLLNVN